ncbi:MAG: DUF4440 domain-containing protein [Cyclobacteriaceae bacterium]
MKLTSPTSSFAQTYPLEEDVSTISGLIKASYEVVSGAKGAKRQWERDRSLHHPDAVYAYTRSDGEQVALTLSEFHGDTDAMIMETDFYESEITREVRIFGNIAHVWSTYQTQLVKDGPVERRGINSIQLIYQEDRWWIISWIFDKEKVGQVIPRTFDWN